MPTAVLALFAALLFVACGMPPVPLSYPGLELPHKDPPSGISVAVYLFEDERGERAPNVAAKQQRLVFAELPISYAADLESEGAIDDFIKQALATEIEAKGAEVMRDESFSKVVPLDRAFTNGASLRTPKVDLVIVGRLNYFGWLEPGFSGLAFQGLMAPAKAYVDIDLAVVDARSGGLLWVGSASSKVDSKESWGGSSDEAGEYLTTALRGALSTVFANHDLNALLSSRGPASGGARQRETALARKVEASRVPVNRARLKARPVARPQMPSCARMFGRSRQRCLAKSRLAGFR